MNIFVAVAFLVSAVSAQTNTSLTAGELSFTGNETDYNTTNSKGNEYDIIVGSTINDTSLVGSIDWMVTNSGVDFLSFKLQLFAPLTNFAVGAINTVYFQIEHPVAPKEVEKKKRLLQDKAATVEPLVKGTGMYEGLITSY